MNGPTVHSRGKTVPIAVQIVALTSFLAAIVIVSSLQQCKQQIHQMMGKSFPKATQSLVVASSYLSRPELMVARANEGDNRNPQPNSIPTNEGEVVIINGLDEQKTQPTASSHTTWLDRIYYINLKSNPKRRAFMEDWLQRRTTQLDVTDGGNHTTTSKTVTTTTTAGTNSIVYQRIEAIEGQANVCVKRKNKNPRRCKGISGLIQTNLHIIDHWNTTGMTLVLEDDYEIYDFTHLEQIVHKVPNDWDIIRFDCWGHIPSTFHFINDTCIFQTKHAQPCNAKQEKCQFWGGTHAMLWRGGDSVQKLRTVLEERPYDGMDGRIGNHPNLISYCVNCNVGKFHRPSGEESNLRNYTVANTKHKQRHQPEPSASTHLEKREYPIKWGNMTNSDVAPNQATITGDDGLRRMWDG